MMPPPPPPLPQVIPQAGMIQPTTQMIINMNAPQQQRQWSVGLFGCFEDFGECCYAYCCPWCQMISLFGRNNETCCSCVFGGPVPLRTKIRTQRNIPGTICDDFCVLMWCQFCALVQMGIELKTGN